MGRQGNKTPLRALSLASKVVFMYFAREVEYVTCAEAVTICNVPVQNGHVTEHVFAHAAQFMQIMFWEHF